MIAAEFTQYLLPDGRTKEVTIDISDDLRSQYENIRNAGARLECEVLTTSEVSLTITDPEEGVDFAIQVVPNGPDVPKAVDRLIRGFSDEDYFAWQDELSRQPLEDT